ncbi:MAG: DNA helicase RecQ [Candidatus Zhuqueibacterota bacterium]
MLTTLKKYFGFTAFRPLQEEIIKTILAKQDVFVLMPTGGGKSLCYQLPSILNDGLTIVVSPLIALMKDQVDSLRDYGITAAFINSSQSYEQISDIKKELVSNKIKLLYVAPERLAIPEFLEFLSALKLCLFTIDEAHCISEWGHDFRPDYRKLVLLKRKFPAVPMAAFTATATPIVQQDIVQHLELKNPQLFKASFNRPNLFYTVLNKGETYQQLTDYLHSHAGDSGIIYCQSRNTVDSLTAALQQDGYKAVAYHAGMEPAERTRNQDQFIKDNVDIVVATIAFGMGIDKPNVRFVIHYDLPKNLERYYQETGRAGRDGLKSDCILFYSYGDRAKIEYFLKQMEDDHEREIAYQKLIRMVGFCESNVCRRKIMLDYFGEAHTFERCDMCDNCLKDTETFDGTIIAQKLLSCVYRLNQRFGLTYVVDVLKGSKSERIFQNGHQKLSTYGIGPEHTKKQWEAYGRQLIQQGHLTIEGGEYPVLKLTEKSRAVLFNQEKVLLSAVKISEAISVREKEPLFDGNLFEALRQLRKRIADERNVPPFVIFHDTTLKEMAVRQPKTWSELSSIVGMGQSKLKRYGPRFLKEILAYRQGQVALGHAASTAHAGSGRTELPTEQTTLRMLQHGLSPEQVAEERAISARTVYHHIETLILSGENLILDRFLPSDKHRVIRKVLHQLGVDDLDKVQARLGDGYARHEIRLVRAKMNAEKRTRSNET